MLALVISSCGPSEHPKEISQADDLFVLLDSAATGVDFINHVYNTEDYNIFNYRNFYNGGGVGIGDINNDELPDIFFTSNLGANKLYLNKGNLQFQDISATAGIEESQNWSTGVVMIDINQDGLQDIYVCNAGYRKEAAQHNALYINNGDLTFTEKASEYGLDDGGYTTHAAFFDYDHDGDLDVYILNNSFIPVNTLNYSNRRDQRADNWDVKEFLKGGGDKLLRNDGGKFIDVSDEAGIYGSLIGFGLGVTVGDINQDGWPDMYVSNDFFERDYLYINQQDGTFSEELEDWTEHISLSSMGADLADINNDDFPDIFVTDMLPDDEHRLKTTTAFENINIYELKQDKGFYHQYMQNTLQLNNKNQRFQEVANLSGVSASDWSWGVLMLDANNDRYSDIFVCNGIYHDVINQDFIDFFANELMQKMALSGKKQALDSIIARMPSVPVQNKVFTNRGDLSFEDVSSEWGFRQKTFSNGAAYADLDLDGDLDFVINNVNMPAMIYQNRSDKLTDHHYLNLRLQGQSPNVDAIGAEVKVYLQGEVLSRYNVPSRGFQSSSYDLLHFGLGDAAKLDSVMIIWPQGQMQSIKEIPIDTTIVISQGQNIKTAITRQSGTALLRESALSFMEPHTEDDYIDFYYERNILQQLSNEGPQALYADLNGDGRKDLVITGAAGQPSQIYHATSRGNYTKVSAGDLEDLFTPYEETAIAAIDKDNDGDLDLYLGAGGNHHPPMSRPMIDRMVTNDGSLQNDPYAIPRNGMNTSKVLVYDFDEDGDEDIFSFSRSAPLNYGVDPPNYVYENAGAGRFREIGGTEHQDLYRAGMVTDAALVDLVGGAHREIVTVSDWGAPKIFVYNGVKYERRATTMDSLHGWWRSVHAADLDGDGDQDLVLGNFGDNFYLREPNLPIKIWVNDYDANGTVEKIMTRSVDGEDSPVFMKKDVFDQVVSLKKNNLLHEEFAGKSIQDLFSAEQLDQSLQKSVNFTKSIIAWNDGGGEFRIMELPVAAQLSSVHAILTDDLDGDGLLDLLLAGNEYGFLPQFGRLDASHGLVLLQTSEGKFVPLAANESGLDVRGMCRQILKIDYNNQDAYLFLLNDDSPKVYVRNEEIDQ